MTEAIHAAVFDGANTPIAFRDIQKPNLQPGESLVKVTACTLCGSDLHTYTGRRETPCPTILGHEIVGVVEETADDSLSVGDRIVWGITVGCGTCFYCERELPQKCENLIKFGHERLPNGGPCRGGLATHCHLPANATVCHVPDQIPDAVICPASCATATIAACFRHLGRIDGATVLLFGAGMLGLTTTAFASKANARAIIVVDVDPARLATAERFGATNTIEASSDADSVRRRMDELTNGYGVDIAIDLSGALSALQIGMASLRIGGRFLWVGSVTPTPPLEIVPETVVRRQLTIQGVHNYHPSDLAVAVRFLRDHHHRFPFADLVDSKQFTLDQADDAFRYAKEKRPIRVMVKFA